MVRTPIAALVVAIAAATVGSTNAHGQERNRERVTIVILACDHGGRATLTTRVAGVETAGRNAGRLAGELRTASSCAEAFNLLQRSGFALVNRIVGATGDYDGDGDVDGRDFLVWQRNPPAPVSPAARMATVLLGCSYAVADELATRVTGSEIAGAMLPSLAAALASGPSCAEAYAELAGAGFGLVSSGPTPVATSGSGDLTVWQPHWETTAGL